ncbi:lipid-binding protein [Ancylomarina sp. YFZ004]
MMKFKYIIVLLVMVSSIVACDPNDTIEDYSTEYVSPLGEMLAGEWYVTYKVDGVDVFDFGYTKVSLYNDAKNEGNKLWIDDHQNFWWMKALVDANSEALTFSATDSDEVYDGITVTITNGKVIPGGGVTAAGNVSDSIYMEVAYSNDAPRVWTVSGVRRTGFLEDEHE